MHMGFYFCRDRRRKSGVCDGFEFMKEEWKLLYPDGMLALLHGRCDLFAILLSRRYGYPIYYRGRMPGNLVHAYCMDGDFYVDARGRTDDEEEFWSEFSEYPYDFTIGPRTVDEAVRAWNMVVHDIDVIHGMELVLEKTLLSVHFDNHYKGGIK